MKTKAIIVEDELLTAERLAKLIDELTDVEIIAQLNSVKNARRWLEANSLPDIIFLDIHLGDGSGFDVLNAVDGFPFVIFTTAYDKYTLEAFQYNSIDYLLKPIKPKELVKAVGKYEKLKHTNFKPKQLESLVQDLKKQYKSRFLFKVGSRYQQVLCEDIAYFFSHDGLNYARTKHTETYITDHNMDELETLLDPENFFRCNRGMILCNSYIKSIHAYFNSRLLLELVPKFEHGQVIVSRDKVKLFKEWLDQ